MGWAQRYNSVAQDRKAGKIKPLPPMETKTVHEIQMTRRTATDRLREHYAALDQMPTKRRRMP
jgi:hypothetical protein